MMKDPALSPPERLIEGSDEVASLLAAERGRLVGPTPEFGRVRAAHGRRQFRRAALQVGALALPLVALFFWPRVESASIVAEVPSAAVIEERQQSEALERVTPDPSESSKKKEEAASPSPPRRVVPAPVDLPQRSADVEPEAAPHAVDCSEFSRAGQFEEALHCLEQRSKGNSMSAELALLESARLRRHVTNDPAGALADLEVYSQRFSRGALRREAGLLRLEVLKQLGRSAQARKAIEDLLPEVPEQKVELLRQGLRLSLTAGDCESAANYLKRLEGAGASELGDLEAKVESCGSPDSL